MKRRGFVGSLLAGLGAWSLADVLPRWPWGRRDPLATRPVDAVRRTVHESRALDGTLDTWTASFDRPARHARTFTLWHNTTSVATARVPQDQSASTVLHGLLDQHLPDIQQPYMAHYRTGPQTALLAGLLIGAYDERWNAVHERQSLGA